MKERKYFVAGIVLLIISIIAIFIGSFNWNDALTVIFKVGAGIIGIIFIGAIISEFIFSIKTVLIKSEEKENQKKFLTRLLIRFYQNRALLIIGFSLFLILVCMTWIIVNSPMSSFSFPWSSSTSFIIAGVWVAVSSFLIITGLIFEIIRVIKRMQRSQMIK